MIEAKVVVSLLLRESRGTKREGGGTTRRRRVTWEAETLSSGDCCWCLRVRVATGSSSSDIRRYSAHMHGGQRAPTANHLDSPFLGTFCAERGNEKDNRSEEDVCSRKEGEEQFVERTRFLELTRGVAIADSERISFRLFPSPSSPPSSPSSSPSPPLKQTPHSQ